jgi:hypothetical protein
MVSAPFVQRSPRQMPAWMRTIVPVTASVIVLGVGGYLMDLGPAVRGTAAAVTGWLEAVTGTGEHPTPADVAPLEAAAALAAPAPKPAAVRKPEATGTLRVTSIPTGAQVVLDGTPRGTTPIDLTDVPPGTYTLELHSGADTVKRSIVVRAGTRTVADESFEPGYVSIASSFPLDIYRGDRRIGSTEDEQIPLPAGLHTLTMVSQRYRFRSDLQVNVRGGEVAAYTATVPTGRLLVTTTAGADIIVDGEKVGAAPIGEIELPVGTRDIVVRHQEHGEKHVTLDVKRDETTEITLPLGAESIDSPGRAPRLAPLSAPPAPRIR